MTIHTLRRRLSPSTIIATAALVAATAGTAAAAAPLITDPSQIAPGVITGLHIKQQAIGKADLHDPYLRIKVNANGTLNGARNDSGAPNVRKVSTGTYDVTFNSGTINGSDGTSDESLLTLPGSLVRQGRRCSSRGCRCRRGELHGPYLYVALYLGGRNRTLYVPGVCEAAVVEQVEVTHANQAALEEITRVNVELLRRRALG